MKKRKWEWKTILDIDANILIILVFIIVSIIGIAISAPSFKDEAPKYESITKVEQYPYSDHSSRNESISIETRYKYISLGEFKLTVYTPYCDDGKWGYQTATGVTSQHLMTCAVDPRIIPYGTEIILRKGNQELRLKAVDCGGSIKGNHIDIFYDDTEDVAIDWLMETFGHYAEGYIEIEM